MAAAVPLLPLATTRARRGPFTPIRRGVGTFEGEGGTIGWLVGDDALVVIDTQFPESAQECWEGLQERSGRGIDLLINTHHHQDHTAGNTVFKPHAARHLTHRNVPDLQRQAAERNDTADVQAYPDQTYDEAWDQELGDERIRLRYYGPAHTGGDSVIHFEKADIVHMGDLMFNRMPPFIDVPGGASTRGWITVLETVHANFTDETIFIYGHGNPAFGITGQREDLLVMRDFLSGLIEYVEAGRKAGKTADDLAAVERLPGFPEHFSESWKQAVPNAILTVYKEMEDKG